MKYEHDLVLKGAQDKETARLEKENKELVKLLASYMPYDDNTTILSLIENYERLNYKYCKYSYILGFTKASCEENENKI